MIGDSTAINAIIDASEKILPSTVVSRDVHQSPKIRVGCRRTIETVSAEHELFTLSDHVIKKIAENIKLINERHRLVSRLPGVKNHEQINSECQEAAPQDLFLQAHHSTSVQSAASFPHTVHKVMQIQHQNDRSFPVSETDDPHQVSRTVDNFEKPPNNKGSGYSLKGIGNTFNRATMNFPSISQIGNVIGQGSKILENPNSPVGSVANLALKAMAASPYGKTGMEAFKLAKTLHEVYKDPKKAAAVKIREQLIGLGTNAVLSAMGPAGAVVQGLQGPLGGMLQEHLLKGPVAEFAVAQAKKVFEEQVEKVAGVRMLKKG